jgi:hypothetical protein
MAAGRVHQGMEVVFLDAFQGERRWSTPPVKVGADATWHHGLISSRFHHDVIETA